MELRLRCEFGGQAGPPFARSGKAAVPRPPLAHGPFFSYRLHEAGTLRCPLLALSGHRLVHRTCPLSGVKQTSLSRMLSGHDFNFEL